MKVQLCPRSTLTEAATSDMDTMVSKTGPVLVADDNEATRADTVRLLRGDGCDVLEAATGREAIELAHAQGLDLVVLEVGLPDMLGFEVAERLRGDPATKAIAILQVSGSFIGAEAQAEGLRRGADAYLVRPFDKRVLLATVAALLRKRSAEKDADGNDRSQRFIADMVPQIIWSCKADGRPDYFNRRWYELTGQRDHSPQTADLVDAMHPEDRIHFAAAWKHAQATGEPLEIECRRWSQSAHAFRWLLIRAVPMKDTEGQVLRWFGTSTDIEGQKQALAERDRLLQELREGTFERGRLVEQLHDEARRKNEFLAALSHELRNPLAPIRNSLYILDRVGPSGEQGRHALEVIDRQVQQMTRLVDDLLDVTRIVRGKIHLQRQDVELGGLVRRVSEDHRQLLERAGVELEVAVPSQPIVVDGDPARLAQVLGNLIQNSAKFTPAGGKVTITLARETTSQAALRVRDTGAGIAADTLRHLFEPFVQAERTLDRSKGGLGLGLALAQGIVQLHGGSIGASSDGPGRGAELVVWLPIKVTPGQPIRRGPEAPLAAEPRRVLIIDDLRDAAESLQEALALAGHVVAIAFDGPSGVAAARSFQPDVVFCDIGLPGMDGFEVARQIRLEPSLRKVFLVALSGYAAQVDIERSRQAGFDEYMAKPPRLEILQRMLVTVPAKAQKLGA